MTSVYFVVESNREQLAQIAALLDGGWPPPAIDSVFTLDDAAAAFERSMAADKREQGRARSDTLTEATRPTEETDDQGRRTALRRAIELAAEARADGDMPYGSLLVGPAGEVLAEDRNTVLTERDITAHPELKLARWAAWQLDADVARGTTMYTSCQPCPMCTGAIARSGLGRVVFALAGKQLQALGAASPDAAEVAYDGPALFDEARVPIDCYYR